jgi:guanylate kinase
MIVFTAPSGAGKTTIVRHLLDKYRDSLSFSISATTRERREREEDGKDYYFLDEEEFRVLIEEDGLIEWEEVYPGKFYGTLRTEVQRILESGKKLVFDIDVYGAQNLKNKYGNRCLTVFVKPPSFGILVQRLRARNTESEESFEKRINKVKKEMLFEHSFDHVLLNDTLEETLKKAEALIENYMI